MSRRWANRSRSSSTARSLGSLGRQLAKFGQVLGEGAVAGADLEDAAARWGWISEASQTGVVGGPVE